MHKPAARATLRARRVAARAYHPGPLIVDEASLHEAAERLRAKDPELVERPHGGGQAIWIDRERGALIGGSEPRKDGLALGY